MHKHDVARVKLMNHKASEPLKKKFTKDIKKDFKMKKMKIRNLHKSKEVSRLCNLWFSIVLFPDLQQHFKSGSTLLKNTNSKNVIYHQKRRKSI